MRKLANLIVVNSEKLKNSLFVDSYINHKRSLDLISSAKSAMPTSIIEYLKLIFNLRAIFAVVKLRALIKTYEEKRLKHNIEYVKKETIKRDKFFRDIGGKSLDYQQIQAVIPDEDNVLVIAGAGSGKTLTIEAKIK
mgnify:FL=1